MTATELIKELNDCVEIYGDCEVIYRLGYMEIATQSDDLEVRDAYCGEDDNKICLMVWRDY